MQDDAMQMPDDYAGNDPKMLADQLQKIANEVPGIDERDDIGVIFYRGELDRIVNLLRGAHGE